jgi:hypothetical protein
MKEHLRMLAPVLAGTFFALVANAQITNEIRANIDHEFMIGDKTLAPGAYRFHMMQDSNLALMSVSSADNKTHFEFAVRQTKANHMVAHTQLVFRKYGDKEVLFKIFEKGTDFGSEVAMNNKQVTRLAQMGTPMEHTEEQK